MALKKCPKCGWELDIRDSKNRCPICSTMFEVRLCKGCGKPFKTSIARNYCDACRYRFSPNKVQSIKREVKREEWLNKLQHVPKDYPRLSEEQWMEAVNYFGACAMCGGESIDTRLYFIPYEDGGKYCDWNIVPVCDACATRARNNSNLFPLIHSPVKGLDDIMEYLEPKLDKAIRRQK